MTNEALMEEIRRSNTENTEENAVSFKKYINIHLNILRGIGASETCIMT